MSSYPAFNKVDLSLLKINNSISCNLSSQASKKYKQITYNDAQFIVIGPKMLIDSKSPWNFYLLNENDATSFFMEIDIIMINMLSSVFPNIENIYIQSIRRSIKNNNLYIRNYSPDREIICFNENDEEITIEEINDLNNQNAIKYVIPLLSLKLNNTYNCKHLEWDVLQIKVFLSKNIFTKCIIVADEDAHNDETYSSLNLDDEYFP